MKIIMQDVTVNQTSLKEGVNKKTGLNFCFRNVDLFVPRDVEDEYSKSKAVTAECADNVEGVRAFQYLQTKEGSKVSLLIEHKEAFSYIDKSGNKQHQQERFKILNVVDSASIKFLKLGENIKVAA